MQHDLFGAMRRERPETSPANDPALSQWFTPSWAADLLVGDALRGLGAVDVLEPSCGDGAILDAIPTANHAIGIEIDPRMAAAARARTGREVILGDYATVDLEGRTFGAIIGNPPFEADAIDALVARAHGLMPDEGVLGLILPAHIPASSDRIARWRERFSIEVQLLPRTLFPRLTLPLAWTRMIKCDRRTLVGLLLFDEQADVSSMPNEARRTLQRGGTWRDVVEDALGALGGRATLREIYASVEPRRQSPNPYWRDKVRQTLAHYPAFARVDETTWRLAA